MIKYDIYIKKYKAVWIEYIHLCLAWTCLSMKSFHRSCVCWICPSQESFCLSVRVANISNPSTFMSVMRFMHLSIHKKVVR